MKSREDIRDDLPLYALGALEADERREVEAAVGADPALAAELREWTELTGLMALEAPDAAPPDIRTRLLARVRGAELAPPAIPGARAADRAAPPPVARRRISWAMPLAAAALAILAVATYREVGWRAFERAWRGERQRQVSTLANLQRELADVQRALTAAQGDLAAVSETLRARENDVESLRTALVQARQSLSILGGRGLSLVALRETKGAPPAEGHVLLSPPTGKALFYAFDLPPVPADKAYELWWITEKEGPVMAGLFRPDDSGLGRVDAVLPSGAGAITAAAVTVEDAAGVPKPQGPMVLIGTLGKS